MTLEIAYVVSRFGADVPGGAELGCRMLAERLAALAGLDVHVYTTCARDANTWANEFAPGDTVENGVRVHRFRSATGRAPEFHDFASDLLRNPARATAAEGRRFIDLQGPVCPDAIDAAASSSAQLLIFYPYLYAPTVDGVARVGARAVMHPAAHDEPALRLPIFTDVFAGAGAFVFQTFAERDLCERRFPVAHRPQLVLGLGVDEHPAPSPTAGRAAAGLDDEPFLLSVGRVEEGKGAGVLADLFRAYKSRHPGPLKLVFVGSGAETVPTDRDIVGLGVVDDDVKRSLMGSCLAFVQPSFYEAFSLVLVEAWAQGAAAIVNGTCGPLREHCDRSGGGVCFDSYASFEDAVLRCERDPCWRQAAGARGRAYVDEHFRWPALIARYRQFLVRHAQRARAVR